MLNLYLNLNESQPIYAYKVMVIKRVNLHSSQMQTILLITLLAHGISLNANLFIHEKLTKLLPRTNKYILAKKILQGKK